MAGWLVNRSLTGSQWRIMPGGQKSFEPALPSAESVERKGSSFYFTIPAIAW